MGNQFRPNTGAVQQTLLSLMHAFKARRHKVDTLRVNLEILSQFPAKNASPDGSFFFFEGRTGDVFTHSRALFAESGSRIAEAFHKTNKL